MFNLDITQRKKNKGIRCMSIAKTVDSCLSDWKFLGLLTFLDPPRPDTAKTIQDAEDYGVKVSKHFYAQFCAEVIYTCKFFDK